MQLFVLFLGLFASSVVSQNKYDIASFDLALVIDGCDVEVTETLEYDFTLGTFDRVVRNIQQRGFTIESATVETLSFPISIIRNTLLGNLYYLVWRFDPIESPAKGSFVVKYLARGAVKYDGGRKVVNWNAFGEEWTNIVQNINVFLSIDSVSDLSALDIEIEPKGTIEKEFVRFQYSGSVPRT